MEHISNSISGIRLRLAELQDEVIDIIYNRVEPDAILYGGTAVWRCYAGNRFSEDIDIYMSNDGMRSLIEILPKYGLRLLSRDRELPSLIRIAKGEISLLLESKEGHAESMIRQYVRVDGSSTTISVFTPVELLVRKIEAYEGRRLIRDVYDIFILTRFLNRNDHTVTSSLSSFLANAKRPQDEDVLKTLIYTGKSDFRFDDLLNYIKRWLCEV